MGSNLSKKKKVFSRRAWNLLRFALLWARKGGVLKRGLMVELRLLPNYLKNLRHTHNHGSIRYQERELSFDETPLFQFKMHRPSSMRFHLPSLPCIKPQVDFDYDFNGDYEDGLYKDEGRKSFLKGDEREEEEEEEYGSEIDRDDGLNAEVVAFEDEGIDLKAEEFIKKFYEQMKLQRQISYLQYTEMLNRGTS
ncbi:Protein of unknown function DUF761 [Macleaya cordata]|uniref:Cotton fiber protein n=1 Tax=Macleaya cordata TaxID=56857 RepID=A0A200R279_MACCD|nr:Protein of unknown function DUF761 [Macleaya cordata]